ncbi:MAG TPA: hypothetical protein VMR97_10350 [Acidimicrobiales bacterium]|nr:hypothetical protein [Acidimicrobiales bacterium]
MARKRRGKGRPVLGAISGLLFGFFVSMTLSVFAGVPLDSVVYYVLTAAGLVGGIALGLTGPIRRGRRQATQAAS